MGCHSIGAILLPFKQSLTSIDLYKQMRLSEQQAQGGPFLHLPRQRATREHHHNYFFVWVLGIKPKFSWLCRKLLPQPPIQSFSVT